MAADRDVWAAPVLEVDEVEIDPHLAVRATFVRHDSVVQPVLAPRFSATPAS